MKAPVFPGSFKSGQVTGKFFLNSKRVKITKIFWKSAKIKILKSKEENKKLPVDKISQQC